MTLLAGAFSVDDSWSPHAIAIQLAQDTCRYTQLHSRILIRDRRVACYVIERQDEAGGIVDILEGDQSIFIAGQIASAEQHRRALLQDVLRQSLVSLLEINGSWTAIAYDRSTGSLRLAGDMLGTAWLYIARWAKGYLFCSDFGALVANFPAALNLDDEALLTMLGISYCPDDRTCFKEITVLPPGQLVELTPQGLRSISKRQVEYGAKYADLSIERKYELLDRVFTRVARDWRTPYTPELVVSLSGGYDSRYGLGVLLDNGIAPRCVTFGHPRSTDARVARRLCKELGLDWRLYSIGHASWDVWQRCVEQAGTVGGFQWANGWAEEWLGVIRESGSHVLLGYLGDALSGKHLIQYDSDQNKWLDNWEHWSLDEGWAGSSLLRPEANAALRDCVRTQFSRIVSERSFAFPHQQALHLDLYGRQRRFVAAQPNLIRRFLTPTLFFYTDYMLEFWANLSFDDLRNQALYLGYAQSRFPSLFKVARRARLDQRAWGAITNIAMKRIPGTKNYLRPSEIDGINLIAQHKGSALTIVKDVEPMIERIFDMKSLVAEIDAFPNTNGLTSVQLDRLINLCILLRLPQKLPRRTAW